jgi:uncharacterized membrane protein YhaH (DUF805 family)
MFKVYFGEWSSGRLARLQYLGYYLLLMLLAFIVIMGALFTAGALGSLGGGDIAATQEALLSKLGVPIVIGAVLFIIAIAVAQFNIFIKRIRDMGLPVLWTVLALIAVSIVLNILFPGETVQISATASQSADGNVTSAAFSASGSSQSPAIQIYDTLIFLALLLIPGDTFKRNGA